MALPLRAPARILCISAPFTLIALFGCSGSSFGTAHGAAGGQDGGSGASGGNVGQGGSSAGATGSGGAAPGAGGATSHGGGVNGGTSSAGGSGTGFSDGGIATEGGVPPPDGGGCPATMPSPDTACSQDGMKCQYGECCPAVATCQSGAWSVLVASCPTPACPVDPPQDGTQCGCGTLAVCDYDQCAAKGTSIHAECKNGTWVDTTFKCGSFACGTQTCNAGDICMTTTAVLGTTYECVSSQCSTPSAPCKCIGNKCTSKPGVCTNSGSGASCATL
jgi:hypothetical protein